MLSHLALSISSTNVKSRLMAVAYIIKEIFNNRREKMSSLDEGYLMTNISIRIREM